MTDQSQAKTWAQAQAQHASPANVILMIQYVMRFIVIKNIRLRYGRYSDMGGKTDQSNKMDFQILVLSKKDACMRITTNVVFSICQHEYVRMYVYEMCADNEEDPAIKVDWFNISHRLNE